MLKKVILGTVGTVVAIGFGTFIYSESKKSNKRKENKKLANEELNKRYKDRIAKLNKELNDICKDLHIEEIF